MTTVSYGFDQSGNDVANISLQWDQVTSYTDGSPASPISYEIAINDPLTPGQPTSTVTKETSATVQVPVDIPKNVGITITPVGPNGQRGEPLTGAVNLSGDKFPPPVPTLPFITSNLAVLTATWDGQLTAAIPKDFDRVEVYASSVDGFTPNSDTYRGSLTKAGAVHITGLDIDSTQYVRMVSVDKRGNKSAPTASVSAVVKPVVATDIILEELDGAIITDGSIVASDKILANSIVARNLAALSVEADKIAANAITAGKIAVGALDAYVMTGSTIQTRADRGASGMKLDGNGLSAWDNLGNTTFAIDSRTGSVNLTGSVTTGRDSQFPRTVLTQYPDSSLLFYTNPDVPPMGINGRFTPEGLTWPSFSTLELSAAMYAPYGNSSSLKMGDNYTSMLTSQQTYTTPVLDRQAGSMHLTELQAAPGVMNLLSMSNGFPTGSSIRQVTRSSIRLWTKHPTMPSAPVRKEPYDEEYDDGIEILTNGTITATSVLGGDGYETGAVRSSLTISDDLVFYQGGTASGNRKMVFSNTTGYGYWMTRMILRPDGTGTSNNAYIESPGSGILSLNGSDVRVFGWGTTTSAANMRYGGDSGVVVYSTSSIRYKDDVQDLEFDPKFLDLRPVTWVSKSAEDPKDRRYSGFIAEEVHNLGLTELVDYDDKGQPNALQYERITAYQQKTIQYLSDRLERLEAKITVLENK